MKVKSFNALSWLLELTLQDVEKSSGQFSPPLPHRMIARLRMGQEETEYLKSKPPQPPSICNQCVILLESRGTVYTEETALEFKIILAHPVI